MPSIGHILIATGLQCKMMMPDKWSYIHKIPCQQKEQQHLPWISLPWQHELTKAPAVYHQAQKCYQLGRMQHVRSPLVTLALITNKLSPNYQKTTHIHIRKKNRNFQVFTFFATNNTKIPNPVLCMIGTMIQKP